MTEGYELKQLKVREEIYRKAKWLLNNLATVRLEPLNELRYMMAHRDSKIVIEGVLPIELSEEMEFHSLFIGIKQPAAPGEPPPIFELPHPHENDDIKGVFFWKKEPKFMRPGRWELYLDYLKSQREREYERTYQLNGKAIDDDDLFDQSGHPKNAP